MARRIQVEIVGDSRSVERAFGRASKAGAGFGSRMRSLSKTAAVGLTAAFVGIGVALHRGFAEFMEGQKVMAQTKAVIKSTGGAANVTAKHVDLLSMSLSRMSGTDDEAIAGAENLLLTFTKIRNEAGKGNRIFDLATKAVLDMSVAMGQDLRSTSIQVGKALNDPVKGITSLRRVGVNFDKANTQMIKDLVEGADALGGLGYTTKQVTLPQLEKLRKAVKDHAAPMDALRLAGITLDRQQMAMFKHMTEGGHQLEAQKFILKELNTEFGGSAKAFGMTLPGAFAKLKNAVDEVLGAFAEGLAPVVQRVATTLSAKLANPAFVARVREFGRIVGVTLLNAFKSLSAWFQANWPQIKQGFYTALAVVRTFANVLRQIANITPGGPGTLIGLIVSGVLLSKTLKLLTMMRTIGGLRGRGGGGKGKGGGKGAASVLKKVLPFGLGAAGGTAAVAAGTVAAVVSAAGASEQHGNRAGQFPNVAKAFKLYYKHQLGAKATGILSSNLTGYSMKSAPDKLLRRAETQLTALYSRQPPPRNPSVGDSPADRPIHVHVHLNRKQVGQAIVSDLQRTGKTNAGSRRGRHGGANLALG